MELNNNKGQVTVIINTSFSEDTNLVKEFVMNEQCPFIESQNEGGLPVSYTHLTLPTRLMV